MAHSGVEFGYDLGWLAASGFIALMGIMFGVMFGDWSALILGLAFFVMGVIAYGS